MSSWQHRNPSLLRDMRYQAYLEKRYPNMLVSSDEPKAPEITMSQQLKATFDKTRELIVSVSALGDQIAGQQPPSQKQASGGPTGASMGMAAEIQGAAGSLYDQLDEAFHALARIQRVLK